LDLDYSLVIVYKRIHWKYMLVYLHFILSICLTLHYVVVRTFSVGTLEKWRGLCLDTLYKYIIWYTNFTLTIFAHHKLCTLNKQMTLNKYYIVENIIEGRHINIFSEIIHA
jgi:hypothetical protein